MLLIEVSPEDVDVNVNPSKTEVRFRKDREMFSLVQRAVRQALVESSPVHSAALATNVPGTTPDTSFRKTPLGSDLLVGRRGPGSRRARHLLLPRCSPRARCRF